MCGHLTAMADQTNNGKCLLCSHDVLKVICHFSSNKTHLIKSFLSSHLRHFEDQKLLQRIKPTMGDANFVNVMF